MHWKALLTFIWNKIFLGAGEELGRDQRSKLGALRRGRQSVARFRGRQRETTVSSRDMGTGK